jgi:hypothetical protein
MIEYWLSWAFLIFCFLPLVVLAIFENKEHVLEDFWMKIPKPIRIILTPVRCIMLAGAGLYFIASLATLYQISWILPILAVSTIIKGY